MPCYTCNMKPDIQVSVDDMHRLTCHGHIADHLYKNGYVSIYAENSMTRYVIIICTASPAMALRSTLLRHSQWLRPNHGTAAQEAGLARHEKTQSWDEALTSQLRHHAPCSYWHHMTAEPWHVFKTPPTQLLHCTTNDPNEAD